MFSFVQEHTSGLFVSAAGHALLLLVLSVTLLSSPPPATLQQLAIEATVVDEGAIRRAEQERERQARLEQQRIEAERRREAEAEQRRREQAEQQRLQRIELEQEAKQQAEAERQRREQERQAEELRRRQAEEARQLAEREAELRVAMQAEERLMEAEQAGLLAQYIAVIRQRVERNWVRPASAVAGLECVVHVAQIPGGEVVDVRMIECNGDPAVVRSIVAAVHKSSPLPPPPEPELFERNLRFTFKPEQ